MVVTCAGSVPAGVAGVHGAGAADGPCAGIRCGRNAECRHEVNARDHRSNGSGNTICVCRDGHTGDPDSEEGCTPEFGFAGVAPTDPGSGGAADEHGFGGAGDGLGAGGLGADIIGCQEKNETYGIGEEWFEGCEYKCQCSAKLEILCQPRCKVRRKSNANVMVIMAINISCFFLLLRSSLPRNCRNRASSAPTPPTPAAR